MPIAKEPLRISDVAVIRAGQFVSHNAVDRYGWHDQVDPDPPPTSATVVEPVTGKGRRRKGA